MEERVKEAMASSRELEQQLEDERQQHITANNVSGVDGSTIMMRNSHVQSMRQE